MKDAYFRQKTLVFTKCKQIRVIRIFMSLSVYLLRFESPRRREDLYINFADRNLKRHL